MMQQLQQHQQQQQRGHRKLDRSHSEPVTERSAQNAGNSNSSRYKTELCRPYEENGTCKYGDKCQFAHGMHELRSLIRHPKYKTELCRTFHTIGFCPYGPRCHFIHNAEEARNNSSPTPPIALASKSAMNSSAQRTKFMSVGGNGSTADSPSPPSSLSESPTSMSTFFTDDLFSNPFSPAPISNSNSSFLFGNDFVSPLFSSKPNANNKRMAGFSNLLGTSSLSGSSKFIPEMDSPSPVGSLASDLDSLSLTGSSTGGSSPPPPPVSHISSPMDTSRALRLPIFSRISETLNED